MIWEREIFLFFIYREFHSTSSSSWIKYTFMKELTCMLFLLLFSSLLNTCRLLFSSQKYLLFFYLGFLSCTFTNHRTVGDGERKRGIRLAPLYHFHRPQRHLDISLEITAESSPLHIASSWTQTRSFWFLSTSH